MAVRVALYGFSGTSMDRPNLQAMLAAADAGRRAARCNWICLLKGEQDVRVLY